MKLRRILLDIDRFVCSKRNEGNDANKFFIDYEDRKKYEEQIMYLQMGINIASMNTNRMPFFIMKSGPFNFIRRSELGDKILFLLNHASQSRILGWEDEYKEVIAFSPVLKMTYEAFCAAALAGGDVEGAGYVKPLIYSTDKVDAPVIKNKNETVEMLNQFVLDLRKALRCKRIKEETKSFRRNADERYLHLMKVAMQAWDANGKQLLLRIDWGFNQLDPIMKPRFKSQEEIIKEFELLDGKRRQMIFRLKRMYGRNLSFYAWKIECGLNRGFHMHWFIALNGDFHRNAWFHGKRIADDWNEHVCGDDSCCWNTIGNKDFRKIYLRTVNYDDKDLPEIMDTFIGYLTKIDITMKLRAPEGYRTFGCTKLKKEKINKPGPKRTKTMVEILND